MHIIKWFDTKGQIYNSYCERVSLIKIKRNNLLMILVHISAFDLRLASGIFQTTCMNRLHIPKSVHHCISLHSERCFSVALNNSSDQTA